MAIEKEGFKFSGVYYNASATTRATQYSVMQARGTTYNLQVIEVTAGTNTPCGIIQNTPLSGQAAEIMVSGISKAVCGAACADGVVVSGATGGKTYPATNGDSVLGQMVVGGTADLEVGSVLMSCFQQVRKA